jgi:hypothetical protein
MPAVSESQERRMFQIVRLELDRSGQVMARWPLQPLYDLFEDAMALAEFDASRCGTDYGFDMERECWWAQRGDGSSYRFVVEQVALLVAAS